MTFIDARAAVAPGAQLGVDVEIAPYAVIDALVKLGDHCKVGPHAFITGDTTIGPNTEIHAGAVIGDAPQDLHYNNEHAFTSIGANCIIREYVTIHRGTEPDSTTVVGNHVMLMAFSHLGHNCVIADDVVVANASLLAGRVHVGQHAFISANVMVHQFVRIGRLAMVGGGNGITQDIPPFCLLQDEEIQGANVVGLRRSGMPEDTRTALRTAIKLYFCYGLSRGDACRKIRAEVPDLPEIKEFIDFVMSTKRGIAPGRKLHCDSE